MSAHEPRIDPSLMNLDGGIFNALPREVLPLEAFHLESYEEPVGAEPLLLRQRRYDSLTPAAMDGALVGAPRRSAWVFGLAVAAGVGIAAGAAMNTPQPESSSAARAEQARAVETQAPVLAAAPAPPPAVEIPKPASRPSTAPRAGHPAAARPASSNAPAAPPAPMLVAPTAELDRSTVAGAVARAARRASSCSDEGGTLHVPVSLTFSTSGRIMSARVTGGALVGTPAGGCVAAALRGVTVPPFAGDPVTVSTTVRIH